MYSPKKITQSYLNGEKLTIKTCCEMLETRFNDKYFRLRSGAVNCILSKEIKIGSQVKPTSIDDYINHCPYCGTKFIVTDHLGHKFTKDEEVGLSEKLTEYVREKIKNYQDNNGDAAISWDELVKLLRDKIGMYFLKFAISRLICFGDVYTPEFNKYKVVE